MRSRRPILLTALVGLALASATLAWGDDRRDHDAAREAVERGEIKRLADILPVVQDRLGGEVVGVEFERDDGRWIYELKILDRAGRRREVYVDARTGEIIKTKGH